VDASRLEKLSIAEQAAHWHRVMQTAGPQERAAFWEWMRASPTHVRELLLADKLDEELGGIDPERRIDISALLAQASSNVAPIREDIALPIQTAEPQRRPLFWTARIAACVAVLAVAASLTYFVADARGTYVTKLGEQRIFELEDGSVVYLNTQSRVKVRFTAQARDIYLRDGQAMFQVHHDPARPFRVHAAETVIQAIGTQFDVRLFADHTMVSVVEGTVQVFANEEKVEVTPSKIALPPPAKITAGEGAVIDVGGKIERSTRVDAEAVTAWRKQQLVFRSETLSRIASEFNRYNTAPRLRIVGDELGARRFNGVFDARNPESLVEYLAQDEGLVFERDGDEVVIREVGSAEK
jgi:transmembrane sensor